MICPHCGTEIRPASIAREFGAAGGRAGTGKSKARPRAAMRAAAQKRWKLWRESKSAEKP
jgi:hypothetical protein